MNARLYLSYDTKPNKMEKKKVNKKKNHIL